MTSQRKSVPPYGYLAVLGLAEIARNSHAHEAGIDAASSVTISNDPSIPNPIESQTLTGTVKADKLAGGDGDDEISGDAGDDRLFGHDGNDHLYGNSYNDRLFGGNNNDWLAGATGDDILEGGDGYDIFSIIVGGTSNNGHDTVTDFDISIDTLLINWWGAGGITPTTLSAAGLAIGTDPTNSANAILHAESDINTVFVTFEGVTQAELSAGAGWLGWAGTGDNDMIYGSDVDDYLVGWDGKDFL